MTMKYTEESLTAGFTMRGANTDPDRPPEPPKKDDGPKLHRDPKYPTMIQSGFTGGGSGGGNRPPGSSGNGNSGDSPFQPTPRNIFRLMAYDHRTLGDKFGAQAEEPSIKTFQSFLRQKEFEQRLDQEIIRRAPPPEVAYKIQRGIEEAAGLRGKLSLDQREHKTLEVKVALYFGPNVTNFNQRYNEAGHPITRLMAPHTEVDVETDSYMIEVTAGRKSKLDQIDRYKSIDSMQRHVILFAPEYKNMQQIKAVESQGAYFAKDFDTLTQLVRTLGLE